MFTFAGNMEKGSRTKQFIIEKSAPIFNQKGIAGTSINDITEATQLARGGVYRHFESKDELSLDVFVHLSNLTHDAVSGITKEIASASGKLNALLDFYDKRLLTRTGGCAILNFGAEADDTNPLMKQKVSEAIHRFKNRIIKIIELGHETGEFSKDFDAELFSIKAFTMIEGAVLISKVEDTTSYMHTVISILRKDMEQYLL